MKPSAMAIAIALLLPAPLALAQDANPAEMRSGVNMLETAAAQAFKRYNIDADPMTLTLGQLALISRALTDPEGNSEGDSKKRTIQFIVGM